MPICGFRGGIGIGAGLLGTLLAGSLAGAELTAKPVTFTKDIAPIFQEKCQECHRAGSMAPMSLVTYEEARPWAKSIKQRVVTRADAAVAHRQDRRHPEVQERLSRSATSRSPPSSRWVDAGAPQGDPKDMPPPKQWPSERVAGWRRKLGRARSGDRSPTLTPCRARPGRLVEAADADIPLTEPRWVRAVEMRPTTRGGARSRITRSRIWCRTSRTCAARC